MNTDEIRELTDKLTIRAHAEFLTHPIFKDLNEEEISDPFVIIAASNSAGLLEQLVTDGHIEEPIEERINYVYQQTAKFLQEKGSESPEKWLNYFGDYKGSVFSYKVYWGDIYPVINAKKMFMRQLNAFFVEPKYKDFYQLSMSAGPYPYPPQMIKEGVLDLQNDAITKELYKRLCQLMDAIKYKEIIAEETVKEKVEKELNNKPLPAFFMNMTQQLLDQADRLAKEYAGPNYDISVLHKIVCNKYQCEKIIREIKAKKITCENEAYFLEDYWTGSGSSKTAFGTKTFEMTSVLRDILTAMAPQSGVPKMANFKVVKQTEPEKKEDINKPNGSQFFEL